MIFAVALGCIFKLFQVRVTRREVSMVKHVAEELEWNRYVMYACYYTLRLKRYHDRKTVTSPKFIKTPSISSQCWFWVYTLLASQRIIFSCQQSVIKIYLHSVSVFPSYRNRSYMNNWNQIYAMQNTNLLIIYAFF